MSTQDTEGRIVCYADGDVINSPMENHTLLKTYSNVHEAQVDKSYLESQGVRCFLDHEAISVTDPIRLPAVGGVKLYVPSDQLETAKNLMEEASS